MATKIINSKKREEHANFCSSLNKFSDMRYVWNRMRIFKRVGVNITWNKWQTKNRKEEIIQTGRFIPPMGSRRSSENRRRKLDKMV